MRCPDCRLPLTYGRCERCHPTAVVQSVPPSGLVDVHQVDESGLAAGETGPPHLQVLLEECLPLIDMLALGPKGRVKVKSAGDLAGRIREAIGLPPKTERAADPQADGTGAQALQGEMS